MSYSDKSGKIITQAFGKIKVAIFATVVKGDLLTYDSGNYGFKLADQSDNLAAMLIACQNGVSGDTIEAAAAVEFETPPTESSGDFSDNNLADAADVGAPLYIGESGKVQSSVGATCTQLVGRILSRTRALLMPLASLSGTALTLSGALAVGTTLAVTGATTLSDDITVGSGKKIQGAGTGTNGIIMKNLKNAAATTLSGTQKDIEIDIGGVAYYFTVYPTKA